MFSDIHSSDILKYKLILQLKHDIYIINPISIVPQELYLDELFQTKEARKLTLQSKNNAIEQIYSSHKSRNMFVSQSRWTQTKPKQKHELLQNKCEQHTKHLTPERVIQSRSCFQSGPCWTSETPAVLGVTLGLAHHHHSDSRMHQTQQVFREE